jgi:hypothetical protein
MSVLPGWFVSLCVGADALTAGQEEKNRALTAENSSLLEVKPYVSSLELQACTVAHVALRHYLT